jgi:hypothetical protein
MGAMVAEHESYLVPTYVRPTPVFVRGKGCYLWDVEGRRYLDFTAGIAVNSLGHCDEGVSRVLSEQVCILSLLFLFVFSTHLHFPRPFFCQSKSGPFFMVKLFFFSDLIPFFYPRLGSLSKTKIKGPNSGPRVESLPQPMGPLAVAPPRREDRRGRRHAVGAPGVCVQLGHRSERGGAQVCA